MNGNDRQRRACAQQVNSHPGHPGHPGHSPTGVVRTSPRRAASGAAACGLARNAAEPSRGPSRPPVEGAASRGGDEDLRGRALAGLWEQALEHQLLAPHWARMCSRLWRLAADPGRNAGFGVFALI